MTEPHPEHGAEEAALRDVFGDVFIDWILAVDGGRERTAEQESVAKALFEQTPQLAAEVPAYFLLHQLTQVDASTGHTRLEDLRLRAGGVPFTLPDPPSENPLLAQLQQWTARHFGTLLLGSGGLCMAAGSSALTDAIAQDPDFPLTRETPLLYQVNPMGAGPLYLEQLGPGIAEAAFRRAATSTRAPQPGDVLRELPAAAATARQVLSGGSVDTLAEAGLSGVLLPDGKTELAAPWGRVRAAHPTDNPWQSRGRSLTLALPDGTQLVSQDSGDLTIETQVPWTARISEPPPQDEQIQLMEPTGATVLAQRVDMVRLAFTLAMADPQAPVLLPTWTKVEDPLGVPGISTTGRPTAALKPRTPTRLTDDQAREWERWIALLDHVPVGNLGHAPQRLLRAVTERQDPVDALVDAVIVWEAVFGTHAEITFRVTGSLARLLHDRLEERLTFVKEAKRIYDMRSKIVHGASSVTPADLNRAHTTAVSIAIDALRTLATTRTDLLALTSSSRRSEHIMLE